MKYVQEHKQQLAQIPEKKWTKKVVSTVIGVASIVGAVMMKDAGWFSDWFLIGLLVFGGYCLAGDLVRGFLGFLPAAIKDIKSALSGKDG